MLKAGADQGEMEKCKPMVSGQKSGRKVLGEVKRNVNQGSSIKSAIGNFGQVGFNVGLIGSRSSGDKENQIAKVGREKSIDSSQPKFDSLFLVQSSKRSKLSTQSPLRLKQSFEQCRSFQTCQVTFEDKDELFFSEVEYMEAITKGPSDPLLIGDYSKKSTLPIMNGKEKEDLKEISGDTLSELIQGKYDDQISGYKIVDCRYPYEYEAGHVKGAMNLHTQKQVYQKFIEFKTSKPHRSYSLKRSLLIFHCEFSEHRGPSMCRFLREQDRALNGDSFPSLHYPEIYILSGGYKSFFDNHSNLCDPCNYLSMFDVGETENKEKYRQMSRAEMMKANTSRQMKRGSNKSVFCRMQQIQEIHDFDWE